MTGAEPHAEETGLMGTITYVGLDVHKATVCVALAETGRGCEVRRVGVFENRPEILIKLAARLSKGGRRLSFCYEAGPCGYGLQRLLTGCGHDCVVVAPSLIPIKAGDRVKTDRRDAMRESLRTFQDAGVDQTIFIQQGGKNRHEHICESSRTLCRGSHAGVPRERSRA